MESRKTEGTLGTLNYLYDSHTAPLYQAAIETTSEAILNALFAAGPMTGYRDYFVPAISVDEIVEMWERAGY